MTVGTIIGLLLLGLGVGFISGLLGIGGAILIIPALVSIYGFTQAQAAGTSLAFMLPPIGIFAVLTYHRAGNVAVPHAIFLAISFALGAWIASRIVTSGEVSQATLRFYFGVFLLYVAGNYLFRGDQTVWAVVRSLLLMLSFLVARFAFRIVGKRWDRQLDPLQLYRQRRAQPPQVDYEI